MERIVVIIGGSSGIGLSVSRLFVRNGDRVYNLSRNPSPESKVHHRTLDIVNTAEVHNVFKEIYEAEGTIDIVVNSAGFSMAAPIEFVESADYRYLFDVNFFGAIEVIKAAMPYIKEKGGRIINVSSMGGVIPIAYDPYYCASKAALNMLTEALQLELRKMNIFVTSLMPGGTRTPFTFKRKIYGEDRTKGYASEQKRATDALNKIEQEGMSPRSVANSVIYISELPDPPIIYAAGIVNKIYYLLSRILSKRLIYWISRRKYKI